MPTSTISTSNLVDGLIIYSEHPLRIIEALDGTNANKIIITGDFIQGNIGNITDDLTSFAQGDGTEASGGYSHAEGEGTIASGEFSHAEGGSTTAQGDWSHAEGQNTTATGLYSHAEGNGSNATNTGAHAEGFSSDATGQYAHASGYQAVAGHTAAQAFGYGVESGRTYQVVLGQFNTLANSTDSFVVGAGATAGTRNNAIGSNNTRTYISNSVYLPNLTSTVQPSVVTFDSTTGQLYYASTSSLLGGGAVTGVGKANWIAVWNSATNILTGSVLAYDSVNKRFGINLTDTAPTGSETMHISGNMALGTDVTSSGANSFVAGLGLIAASDNQTIIGKYATKGNAANFIVGVGANNLNRVDGLSVNFLGTAISNSVWMPNLANISQANVISFDTASGKLYYIPTSSLVNVAPDKAIQFATGSKLSGSNSFIFNYTTNQVLLTGSISASTGANTVGFFGTASWAVSASYANTASYAVSASYALSSSYALSASYANTASYVNILAGPGITVNYQINGIAVSGSSGGIGTPSSPVFSVQFNSASVFKGESNFLYYPYISSTQGNNLVLGTFNFDTASYNTLLINGGNVTQSAASIIISDSSTIVTGSALSIINGSSNKVNTSYYSLIGGYNNTTNDLSSDIIWGSGNTVSGSGYIGFGLVGGSANKVISASSGIVYGNSNTLIGDVNYTRGNLLIGEYNYFSGSSSQPLNRNIIGGWYNSGSGTIQANIIGGNLNYLNNVYYTLVIGQSNTASSATNSAVGGNSSKVTTNNSLAFGNAAWASGNTSTAFGYYTTASSTYAMAIGQQTVAGGQASFAGGTQTLTSAGNTFAFGNLTTASAAQATAFGNGTVAGATNQFVVGAYNATSGSGYSFIVGNGTSTAATSDAFKVRTGGTAPGIVLPIQSVGSFPTDLGAGVVGEVRLISYGGIYKIALCYSAGNNWVTASFG